MQTPRFETTLRNGSHNDVKIRQRITAQKRCNADCGRVLRPTYLCLEARPCIEIRSFGRICETIFAIPATMWKTLGWKYWQRIDSFAGEEDSASCCLR